MLESRLRIVKKHIMNTIWLAFITGVTAGGISCLAVQGGLLASSLSSITNSNKLKGTTAFVVAKAISYTILGVLLGFFGNRLSISPQAQGWLQVGAGLYMLVTAANLLEIHPIFRYFVIQPPKWAYRLLKRESSREVTGPAVLGALTVLVPCGITQGMMIMAISSGNPISGGLILLAFTIGTSPLFFLLGLTATQFLKRRAFVFISTALLVFLGINSISAGNALRGSPHTIQNYLRVFSNSQVSEEKVLAAVDESGIQNVDMEVSSSGYKPRTNTLKVGIPVKLKFTANNAAGCVQVFTIPSLNIKKVIPSTGREELTFTPTKTGKLPYSCAMGMYTGEFLVI